jgi:hypothetical protein
MTDNTKREAALELLAATPIWKMNYASPALRLLWRLGIDCPPPHLRRFSRNALGCGAWFGVCWMVIFYLIQLLVPQHPPFAATFPASICVGALYGLWTAAYYAYGRRKYHLPLWEDFDPLTKREAANNPARKAERQ